MQTEKPSSYFQSRFGGQQSLLPGGHPFENLKTVKVLALKGHPFKNEKNQQSLVPGGHPMKGFENRQSFVPGGHPFENFKNGQSFVIGDHPLNKKKMTSAALKILMYKRTTSYDSPML